VRILLIEDNSALADLIKIHLIKFYVIDQANNFKKACYFFDIKNYDLLIADLDSTIDNGHALCHYLRDKYISLPVLLLTTTSTVKQRINCLQRGADYLIKPFHILELVAKAKILLKKSYKKLQKLKNIDLELNLASRQAYVSGKEIKLNRKEFSLLEVFLCHSKQVMSKAILAEKIWQEDKVLMGNTIETTIANLRKKIGKSFIKTIKGVGYVAG